MKYSKLLNEMEVLNLKHKHEIEKLKMEQMQEKLKLINQCTHKYDDGTDAKRTEGTQWDFYYKCTICQQTLR